MTEGVRVGVEGPAFAFGGTFWGDTARDVVDDDTVLDDGCGTGGGRMDVGLGIWPCKLGALWLKDQQGVSSQDHSLAAQES